MKPIPDIRVFPRRTVATPTDKWSFTGPPPLVLPEPFGKILVSVAFTWDIPRAMQLAKAWEKVGKVEVGGPALKTKGEEFVPGRFMKKGWVITSRGCINKCWFCEVWKRDGTLRELPITEGYIVQDDNLLACSRPHIEAVFAMILKTQGKYRAKFTGGLEAKLLKDWHIDLLLSVRPKQVYMAYDTPDDLEPLTAATKRLTATPLRCSDVLRCYVLTGYPKDTVDQAEARMNTVVKLGLVPFTMFWRNEKGQIDPKWKVFRRRWALPFMLRNEPKKPQIKPSIF